jgi:signal transduction histidine kinase
MLNISRIDSGRMTITIDAVDMISLVEQVIDEVQAHAQELGVTVVLEKQDSLPNVLADADKIKEVIFNLVGNSLKFTPNGGTITVSFKQIEDMVEIKVKDTGIGIEEDDMPKLFQKFGLLEGSYTTNQSSTSMGTGLGLFICREIIELHEGQINASSEGKNKGAEFTFTLKTYSEDGMKKLTEKFKHDETNAVGLLHTQL